MKTKDNFGGRIDFLIYKLKRMTTIDIINLKVSESVDVVCDECGKIYKRTIKNIKKSRFKFNKDICISCAAKLSLSKKPQCSKDFWNLDKKEIHSKSIKNSENYYNSIKNRPDISGEKNPMYGKKHLDVTKKKMSTARTGKIGEKSTAWKGGKLSITRLVKGYQNRNGWYKMIYERDGFKCVKCGSKNKIEAHHIKPIKEIVDEYKDKFDNNNELYLFLISLDIIIDSDLKNGITLCRECHIKEHINFGSHFPKISNQ